MNHWGGDKERQEAWGQAKLAVRAYARRPSDHNATKVNKAWRVVRQLAASSTDRQAPSGQAVHMYSTGKRASCFTPWFLPTRKRGAISDMPYPAQET